MFLTGTIPGLVHLCMGAYGDDSSLLRNLGGGRGRGGGGGGSRLRNLGGGGFKLVTNLKETKEAKCKHVKISTKPKFLLLKYSITRADTVKIIFLSDQVR